MRTLISFVAVSSLFACSVPDKQPAGGDGSNGSDTDPQGVPETTITSSPAEFSNSPVATFEFESSKPGARFECFFDGEAPGPCTSPASKSLSDGPHSFSVRAISASGEPDETPAEALWSIDTVAPITTITEAPPTNDNSTSVHFAFIANEMNVTFECALDGADFEACSTRDEFGPIADGAHSFAVRAKDRAGNIDSSPAIHTWSVDTSTPDTTLLSGPMGSVPTGDASFTFLSPDAGPGATFDCSLDGSAFAACTSPATYAGLAMGVHSFSVRVKDATGNLDPTPATRTWTVDLTAPETTITRGPSGTIGMASASITFTSNETDVTFACSLDGAAASPCTSPYNATMLAQGAHTFTVAATDMAGHTDATPATASWTVDTAMPALSITGGPADGGTSGPRVTFSFTSSEGTPQCRVDNDPTWRDCTGTFSFNAPAGVHTFYLRAADGAGNTSTLQRTFTIVCDAPDAAGAIGLLHLDDNMQELANAASGAGALLGTTADAETVDPAFAAARFGTGLTYTASEGDLVSWPLAGGSTSNFTIEQWVAPEAASGMHDVFVSGDSHVAIRVVGGNGSSVRFNLSVIDSAGSTHTVTSANAYMASTWHHVLASLDGGTLHLWVDGDRSDLAGAASTVSLDAVTLGSSLGGQLDEVWVSTTATATDDAALARYCPLTETQL